MLPLLLRRLLLGATLVLTNSCIDPFDPAVDAASKDYLVVDGFLNSRGVTVIKLSHTVALSATGDPPAETRAQVYIEDEQGTRFPLREAPAGTYTSAALTLNPARRHRLSFTTVTGRAYASDYTEVKVTPEIDGLSWAVVPNGLELNVSTHDDTQNSRYYRWSVEETWLFRTPLVSELEYVGDTLLPRRDDISACWGTDINSSIRLFNTTRLTQDVVASYPVQSLPPTSVKLGIRYSILVKQRAQTAEEYRYWEALRKNTEDLGTLFDPLPSQLTGNVHDLADPAALVLGFVGAYSVTEKRLFVDRTELPGTWHAITGYEFCREPDSARYSFRALYFGPNGQFVPLRRIGRNLYAAGLKACADCRLRGTNVRPSFWR